MKVSNFLLDSLKLGVSAFLLFLANIIILSLWPNQKLLESKRAYLMEKKFCQWYLIEKQYPRSGFHINRPKTFTCHKFCNVTNYSFTGTQNIVIQRKTENIKKFFFSDLRLVSAMNSLFT